MNEQLRNKVLEWLRKTGFPLELRVGRRLQSDGWTVSFSRLYDDPETGKTREIDVQASIAETGQAKALVAFTLCLECKTTATPWIALGSGLTMGTHQLYSLAAGELTRMTLMAARDEKLAVPAFLPAEAPRVGGIIRFNPSMGGDEEGGRSSPYSALLQARSGALALDHDLCISLLDELGPAEAIGAVICPVVVLSGTLLLYGMTDTLEESLEEVDAVGVSVPGAGDQGTAFVPVVTESWLEKRGVALQHDFHGFCASLLPFASLIAGALRLRFPEDKHE